MISSTLTSKRPKCVRLFVIELEHPIFGFEQTLGIEHTLLFTELPIKQTQYHFWTSNTPEHVHILVIQLEHPKICFEQMDIEH